MQLCSDIQPSDGSCLLRWGAQESNRILVIIFLIESKEGSAKRRYKSSCLLLVPGHIVHWKLAPAASSETRGHLETGCAGRRTGRPTRSPGHCVSSPQPRTRVLSAPHEGHQPGPELLRVTLAEYFGLGSPPSGVGFHIFRVKLSLLTLVAAYSDPLVIRASCLVVSRVSVLGFQTVHCIVLPSIMSRKVIIRSL